MRRKATLLIILALIASGAFLAISFWKSPAIAPSATERQPPSEPQFSQPPVELEPQVPAPSNLTLGDRLLSNYGNSSLSLKEDLTLFKNFTSNVFLLVKQRDSRHYATNQDLAEFLLGKRGQSEPYLSSDSPVLNPAGQLVDRYGSPLIIHPLSQDRFEIRSAGLDKVPYTEDDLVR